MRVFYKAKLTYSQTGILLASNNNSENSQLHKWVINNANNRNNDDDVKNKKVDKCVTCLTPDSKKSPSNWTR